MADHPGGSFSLGDPLPALPSSADPAQSGRFGDPFTEPSIAGQTTAEKCVTRSDGVTICKPTAGSVSVLRSGKILYWNAIEGTENIELSLITDYGSVALNDQTRVLDMSTTPFKWTLPWPNDAGANPDGEGTHPILPGQDDEANNNGALFCSDLTFLADGRVLAAGGTAYYQDPEIGNTGFGVVELEGLRNSRIYDPATNRWSQTGSMARGRWYPSLVTLGNGKIFVASGVEKLVKPVYPDHPLESFANVRKTETYDPATGRWTDNGAAAARSLPLFPRLHMLPNGHVYYNAAGQSFNPFGQSYDEALWNIAASYNPGTGRWTDLGVPGLEGGGLSDLLDLDFGQPLSDLAKLGIPGGGKSLTVPGFRGSTFSVMLPLQPDVLGRYTKASFLSAGGVVNPVAPSPGSYFSTSDARITTVDTQRGNAISTVPTGDLNRPRWYTSGVLLPTGEAIAFSGSDRDEVAFPGTEFPIKQAELWDPKTGDWRPLAEGHRPRTYHNTAVILPDARVLIGGHAPITTLYLKHITLPGGFSPNERDPSFEVYSPPYLFRGARPRITSSPSTQAYGRTFDVVVDRPAADIESVVLVRNPTETHLVDDDQRNVVLRVLARTGSRLTVAAPPNGNVAPPGPYMLFVNRKTAQGSVPSVSKQLTLR
ncbi:MAG TPA: galactose oxidase-like domain-containing protein [Thermoleophilaceae bacterium]|nr:galactose oxidase-like domain-containing protein [Thermoleophilaceae bacterium]